MELELPGVEKTQLSNKKQSICSYDKYAMINIDIAIQYVIDSYS